MTKSERRAYRQDIHIEDLLIWTYQVQRAHRDLSRGAGLHPLERLADGYEDYKPYYFGGGAGTGALYGGVLGAGLEVGYGQVGLVAASCCSIVYRRIKVAPGIEE